MAAGEGNISASAMTLLNELNNARRDIDGLKNQLEQLRGEISELTDAVLEIASAPADAAPSQLEQQILPLLLQALQNGRAPAPPPPPQNGHAPPVVAHPSPPATPVER